MVALAAYFLPNKFRLTTMAFTMDTLANWLTNKVLSALFARYSNSIHMIALSFLVPRGSGLRANFGLALILGLLDRVTRTLLATLVSTTGTGFVRPITSRTLVTSTMNSHTDVFLHPFSLRLL
jgi:hypothetical protein